MGTQGCSTSLRHEVSRDTERSRLCTGNHRPPKFGESSSQDASQKSEAITVPEEASEPSNTDGKRTVNVDESILGTNVECMVTTHIDDIKGSGAKQARELLHNVLCKDYGNDVRMG